MRATWLCLGVIGAVALAGPGFAADAPPAEKPAPRVGDVLEYTKRFVTIDCKSWEVTALDKDGYTLTQCGDNLAYIDCLEILIPLQLVLEYLLHVRWAWTLLFCQIPFNYLVISCEHCV